MEKFMAFEYISAGKIDYYVVENENHGTNIKEIEDSAVYLKSIL